MAQKTGALIFDETADRYDIPVSYTHLDVYKRQVFFYPQNQKRR